MKIYNFDLIVLIIMMFIVIFVYEQIKNMICSNKETFQSTTTGYTTDIEAIRNLSSIATQLTLSGGLVVPGALQINSKLDISGEISIRTGDVKKQVKIGSSQIKFRGDGIVHYGLTNDTDGKFKISNLSDTSEVGSGFLNDCLTTDSKGNTTIYGNTSISGKIATNGLDPNNMPSTISGGIRTYGVYSTNTIATGTTGSDLKAYMNNKGEGYFTGRVDVSGNDLFSNNLPITRNYIVGTLSYTGTDNGSAYKQVTISSVISSPYVTISGKTIKFNYANLYKIEGYFTVSGANGVSGGSSYDKAYFIFGDSSGNLPTNTYINVSSGFSDNGYPAVISSKNEFRGKVANDGNAYTNCNYFTYLFIPTVGKEYYFQAIKHKISAGTFVISAI